MSLQCYIEKPKEQMCWAGTFMRLLGQCCWLSSWIPIGEIQAVGFRPPIFVALHSCISDKQYVPFQVNFSAHFNRLIETNWIFKKLLISLIQVWKCVYYLANEDGNTILNPFPVSFFIYLNYHQIPTSEFKSHSLYYMWGRRTVICERLSKYFSHNVLVK